MPTAREQRLDEVGQVRVAAIGAVVTPVAVVADHDVERGAPRQIELEVHAGRVTEEGADTDLRTCGSRRSADDEQRGDEDKLASTHAADPIGEPGSVRPSMALTVHALYARSRERLHQTR